MKHRTLGKTGLEVSEIGFGGWAIGGAAHGESYGPTDDRESVAAIRRALELGCTFFDTADSFGRGHSEELLGEALEGRRAEVVLATKIGADFYHHGVAKNFSRSYATFAVEQCLRRLRTETIDLLLLQNPSLSLIQDGAIFEAPEALKLAGKVRFWGVSVFDTQEAMAALPYEEVAAIQITYNLFNPEAQEEVFPAARSRGAGIVAREPLSNGLLSGKYNADSEFPENDVRHAMPQTQKAARTEAAARLRGLAAEKGLTLLQLALQFVLAQQDVSVAVVGIKTQEQAEEDLAASALGELSEADLQRALALLRDEAG